MDELLNLSLSGIHNHFDEFLELEDDDESFVNDEATDAEVPGLLYYCSKFYELLSGNIFLTTYVERGRNEYFAGFSNIQFVALLHNDRHSEQYCWIHLSLVFRAFRSTASA
ncbi:uncharacterized protein LOC108105258 [Drosophila eugracilis]|uniref:uncharacterized protein LOC108105258 n=1 Tax=Drosophila eugracilis TaxID=29029 RepID=UPI001BDADDF2|nr:uncharacterized protein LOC108105258 [Drosophila eugracilis]